MDGAADTPFWKRKTLDKMTPEEWEALCDGCGICCLQKIEDEETGEMTLTSVTCEFLDLSDCRCTVYAARTLANPHCIRLSPGRIKRMDWLPETCAYRRVAEGRELAWWHPLVSGDRDAVHRSGASIRDKAVSGKYVHPDDVY